MAGRPTITIVAPNCLADLNHLFTVTSVTATDLASGSDDCVRRGMVLVWLDPMEGYVRRVW